MVQLMEALAPQISILVFVTSVSFLAFTTTAKRTLAVAYGTQGVPLHY